MDMLVLICSILLLGLLIYMIVLTNEMKTICERLQGRTKRLMNKIEKMIKKDEDTEFIILELLYLLPIYQHIVRLPD